ncbi:hypothetical protein JCM11251_004145 [Rhodosporidiobolus azoricus]
MTAPPPELVLAVFLHGFKGGADTFAQFPDRLRALLLAAGVEFEPVVYPAYDTRGELVVAVDNHVAWLTELVAEKTALWKEKGGTGPVRVILLGHSMGGLVISDTLLSTLPSASLPILGIIAYDSPLLGLNPKVFKSTFDKALDYASKGQTALAALGGAYGLFRGATGGKTAQQPAASTSTSSASSSRSSSKARSSASTSEAVIPPPAESPSATPGSNWFSLPYLVGAGIAGLAAAGGAAYYNRDVLAQHWSWATSHLSFVGELWKTDELERRLEGVVKAREKGVGFHCFYTLIPSRAPSTPTRTFLVLPHSPHLRSHFTPSSNSLADDEIHAHTTMFDESDGVYALGQETARLVLEWVEEARRGRMGYWEGEGKGKGKEKGGTGNGEKLV